jgi:predicted nucleic acid-binding Zn ribbon protein
VKEAEVLLKQEQELKVLHDVQEAEYTEVVRVLTDQEQVLVKQMDTEDAEEEQALAGLSTLSQCEAFSAQLKAQIEAVRVILVGGTRCVTSSTGNIMNRQARITLNVEFIRGYVFICLFDV